ncbi:MAG: hypothetical protein ACKO6Q_05015 [Bacteroidota bacterium]
MKVNIVPSLVSLGLSLLLAYGFYELGHEPTRLIHTIGGGLFMLTALTFLIGVQFENPRTTTNVRTLSSVFFLTALLSHVLFSLTSFSISLYIITEGILIMIYILMVYSLSKADV